MSYFSYIHCYFIIEHDNRYSILYEFQIRKISNDLHLVPIIPLCSTRAVWKKNGVTVAGFTNGTASSSLSGLARPTQLFVDAVGNMHIVDLINNRILYWPMNSAEGHIVAGTGYAGSDPNELNAPFCFAGDH